MKHTEKKDTLSGKKIRQQNFYLVRIPVKALCMKKNGWMMALETTFYFSLLLHNLRYFK